MTDVATPSVELDFFNSIKPSLVSKTKGTKLSKTKQKEQRIRTFLSNYAVEFDMEDSAIDLRTMADNYPNGIIPNKDIGLAVEAVLGTAVMPRLSIDPETLNVPKFAWVHMDDIAINPRFQRDVIPNHIAKIEALFKADTIIVPCAVKDPVSGKFCCGTDIILLGYVNARDGVKCRSGTLKQKLIAVIA